MSDNSAFERSMMEAMEKILHDTAQNMVTACLMVEGEAKKRCPVDMGALRASVTSDVTTSSSEITGIIGAAEEYAPYVHEGTGIYAKGGGGRKTPWGYTVKAGKHKGFHWTHGQKPKLFLEDAKNAKQGQIARILGGK